VVANYQMWRIALATSSLLSDDIRARRLIYIKAVTGVEKYKPRWKECVSWTTSYLSIASSALYVRKNFNEKSKHDSLEVVNMIRDEFASTLKKTEWMDEKTRTKALEKAKKMINFIGYPDELKDDKKLNEYYHGLEINNQEFFKSYLKLNRFSTKKEMSKFRERVNKTDWEDHAEVALVNAFYSPSENSIRESDIKSFFNL
jgi:predicted metalloendopeptidase